MSDATSNSTKSSPTWKLPVGERQAARKLMNEDELRAELKRQDIALRVDQRVDGDGSDEKQRTFDRVRWQDEAREQVRRDKAAADAASLAPARAKTIDCRTKPDNPTMLVRGLIYEGTRHWLGGHVKDGKTIVSLWIATRAMEAGRHVCWLDWENGETRLQRWLYELKADPEMVDNLFHLFEDPSPGLGGEAVNAQLDVWAAQWPNALVVVDSFSKANPKDGRSENSSDDVTEWTEGVTKPLAKRNLASLVIDHEKKDGNANDRYGRGSGAKGADAEVSFYLDAIEPLSRDSVGKLHIVIRHDRDGFLPSAGIWLEVGTGDGSGYLPVKIIDAPAGRGEVHEQLVHIVLSASSPLSKADIVRQVQALHEDDTKPPSLSTIKRAVDDAYKDGDIDKEPGDRGRYGPPPGIGK